MKKPVVSLLGSHSPDSEAETIPLRGSTLSNQVYEHLWQRIISRQLLPGDKLSDVHLSEELGVSRTPVREALHRLAQDGIVRTESHRGFFVTSFDQQDVHEIYDLRAALEVLAVRLAFPKFQPQQLREAGQHLDAISRLIASGDERANDAFLLVDRAFHDMVAQTAGNRRLAASLTSLQGQLGVFQVYGTHFKALIAQSLAHHQQIVAALQRGDCPGAEQAMEQHIHEVKGWMLRELAQAGLPAGAAGGG